MHVTMPRPQLVIKLFTLILHKIMLILPWKQALRNKLLLSGDCAIVWRADGSMEASEDVAGGGRETDWALLSSPGHPGSCLQLSTSKPCVNKATALLAKLKEQLTEWQAESLSSSQRRHKPPCSADKQPVSSSPASPSQQFSNDKKKVKESSLHPSIPSLPSKCAPELVQEEGPHSTPPHPEKRELVVLGTQTGVTLQLKPSQTWPFPSDHFDWTGFSDIIGGSLHLVLRLDGDRTETVERLESERKKVKQLRALLEEKARHRLTVLPRLVQKGW